MKTPNDFAKLAIDLGRTAADLKPADNDPYADSLKLMIFHLQTAASKARQIAEHMTAAEEGASR